MDAASRAGETGDADAADPHHRHMLHVGATAPWPAAGVSRLLAAMRLARTPTVSVGEHQAMPGNLEMRRERSRTLTNAPSLTCSNAGSWSGPQLPTIRARVQTAQSGSERHPRPAPGASGSADSTGPRPTLGPGAGAGAIGCRLRVASGLLGGCVRPVERCRVCSSVVWGLVWEVEWSMR